MAPFDGLTAVLKHIGGSMPRIRLVAATSSAPSAAPWILPVFCLFGAGQPMMVRSLISVGRSVSARPAIMAAYSFATSSW